MAPRVEDDRGETLLELLITVVVLGITVVAVLGGLMTSIRMSDVHRKQATAGGTARSYAESVERFVAGGGYTECATAAAHYGPGTVGFTAPAGYTAGVTSVEYWNAASRSFTGTCASTGLERVTVQVSSADGRAVENSVVVLRKPCGQGSTC